MIHSCSDQSQGEPEVSDQPEASFLILIAH